MAIDAKMLAKQHVVWTTPVWPDELPTADAMRSAFNAPADELTISFGDDSWTGTLVPTEYVATPGVWYAGMLVRWDTGEVVGVQVDFVTDHALELHPAWRGVTTANPPSTIVRQVVNDIKLLFDRYGVASPDDD